MAVDALLLDDWHDLAGVDRFRQYHFKILLLQLLCFSRFATQNCIDLVVFLKDKLFQLLIVLYVEFVAEAKALFYQHLSELPETQRFVLMTDYFFQMALLVCFAPSGRLQTGRQILLCC